MCGDVECFDDGEFFDGEADVYRSVADHASGAAPCTNDLNQAGREPAAEANQRLREGRNGRLEHIDRAA